MALFGNFEQVNLQQRMTYLVVFCCAMQIAVIALSLYESYATQAAYRTHSQGQQATLVRMSQIGGSAGAILPADLQRVAAESARAFEQTQAAQRPRFYAVYSVMVLLVALSGLLGVAAINGIFRIAEQVRSALNSIATGNLTTRVGYRGGVFKRIIVSLNVTAEKLQAVITQASQVSTHMATAATELSQITEDTSRDMKTQQADTDQTVVAMSQMSVAAQAIAKNASQASLAASDANKQAASGAQTVVQVITVIQGMATEMEGSTLVINKLQKESTEIGAVLEVIRSIADQTNLLALNAAIEAARAGEQGRGFAVVADEVRTLAGRTQQATVEIQRMIERLQRGAKEAVQSIAKGSERVRAGVTQASQASAALGVITKAVSEMSDKNRQIASAAEEQSAMVAEVNLNIESINKISGRTADGASSTANAAIDLAKLSTQLSATLSQFKV